MVKKPTAFYLFIPFLVLFLLILFLDFIPQQNLVFGQFQQCEGNWDCYDVPGNNYCCNNGNSVCNEWQVFSCNFTVEPPGCAQDFRYEKNHIESCPCGCSNGSCNTCGVCSPGETQTETTDELSCTSNPSQCGGYAGRCDQYRTVLERNRTCNSNRQWNEWSDWYTIDEYPQCPTDSRTNCGTCTAPPSCEDGSCNNGETCSTCSQDCGSCPPTARYRCISGSCQRDDAGGTTTNPSCGGLCSRPPPGCPNVTVSVSPNPVNINSPVTFSATSSHPYRNANVSHGGGAQGGDDFSIIGSYTWRWAYDPPGARWGNSSSTAGTYNATFSGDRPGGGSSCTFSTSYTVQNNTPANLQVADVPVCSSGPYNVNLGWTNTNNVLWADISSDSFANYSNKDVSNQTSTAAPAGFKAGTTSLTLNPGTTYQWRLWNGSSHTSGPSFSTPSCVPPTPTISTPACIFNGNTGPGINISWAAANPVVSYVDISPNNFATSFYNKAVTGSTSTDGVGFGTNNGYWNGSTWSSNTLLFQPNTPYYVRTWNGYLHNNAPNPSFSIPLCVPEPPFPPEALTANCPAPGISAALSWPTVQGATSYNVTVSDITVGGTPTTYNTSSISYSAPTTSGNIYSWSVSACNSAGCSAATPSTSNFTCIPPPCPGGLGACGSSPFSSASIGVCSGGNWIPNHGPAGAPLGYDAWCRINANSTRAFCYQCNTTISPWIQVTGDVHSNSRINAPGGPR